MIVIDTSVWADHFRQSDPRVGALLRQGQVLMHPFVIGELAMGNLRDWPSTVADLRALPAIDVASDDDLYAFVAAKALMGSGLGFVDAHIIASATLRPGCQLWSRDKRLHNLAETLGLAHASSG